MAVFNASLLQMALGSASLACLFVLLGAISLIDWRTRRIPNLLVMALAILRLLVCVFDLCLCQKGGALDSLVRSCVLALAFAALLYGCKTVIECAVRKDCLGMGDVKLVVVGYAFLSFDQAIVALAIACLVSFALALFFRIVRKDPTFPFGPALCLGIAIGVLVPFR